MNLTRRVSCRHASLPKGHRASGVYPHDRSVHSRETGRQAPSLLPFYEPPSETRVHHASLRLFDIRIPLLDEAPEECERRVGDVSPAAVNGQRVPAIGDRDNLSNADIPLLALERRVRDLPRNRVVLLARDDQQRPALRALDVDIRLRPWVEVGGRGLKDGRARRSNRDG